MKINSIIDLVKDLDTSRQTKNLNKLLIRILLHLQVEFSKEIHPGPCEMHLNVNRNNKALQFYQHLGMEKVAEGDFHIGYGYYMNDYIMGLKI